MTAEIRVTAVNSLSTQIPNPLPTRHAADLPHAASRRLPGIARLAVGLEIFVGLGALFGGGQFIVAPDGHLLGMTVNTLAGTPFHSFLVPGLLLFSFVGVGPLVAAAITARRQAIAPLAALGVGLTLMGWITVEMVMMAGFTSLLWALYLVLGTATAALGLTWWRSESWRTQRLARGEHHPSESSFGSRCHV
jgi:hypothetical protein